MTTSDWIYLSLSILSLIIAIISVISVILTLNQNNKMIEGSTRPYIVVYGEETNFGDPMFYLVIKNFGKTSGIIKNITCDIDLSKYNFDLKIIPFQNLIGTVLVPNQNITCNINYQKLNSDNIEIFNFVLKYENLGKVYEEIYPINYLALKKNITTKISTENKELKTISYTLQEMVQKNL